MTAAIAPKEMIMSESAKSLPAMTENNLTIIRKPAGPANANMSHLALGAFTAEKKCVH